MRIVCKGREEFVPVVASVVPIVVPNNPPTSEAGSHRQLTFTVETSEVSHNDFLISGINLENATATPSGEVDASNFPLLRRPAGFTGFAHATIDNGRAKTNLTLYFGNSGGQRSIVGPVGHVTGSYAKFSFDIVNALALATPDNKVIESTAPFHRANVGIYPHAAHTGLVWSSHHPLGGRKFAAITRRVVVGCGHYSWDILVGNQLQWLTVDNEVVTRTVIAKYNLVQAGEGFDLAFYLLDEELPEELDPMPIVGLWYYNIQTSSPTSRTTCPQSYGIINFGNDGHFCPLCPILREDDYTNVYDYGDRPNLGMNGTNTGFYSTLHAYWANEAIAWNIAKFTHNTRGGDSGSIMTSPIANGKWALADIGWGVAGHSEAIWNALIAKLWTIAGEGGSPDTVTIAPDPTA